jgi:hypothetical protein
VYCVLFTRVIGNTCKVFGNYILCDKFYGSWHYYYDGNDYPSNVSRTVIQAARWVVNLSIHLYTDALCRVFLIMHNHGLKNIGRWSSEVLTECLCAYVCMSSLVHILLYGSMYYYYYYINGSSTFYFLAAWII